MKKYFVYLASAALLLACNKEEINTPVDNTPLDTPVATELITVDLNPETKTSLDGMNTKWVAGDKVSVTVGGQEIGTLALVEGTEATFSGEIVSGHDGEAILKYPAGVASVPTTQVATANTFANGAALLEGTTTVDALRAGEAAQLSNTTALLQFSVNQAGDVTFEVGNTKYTVTDCKTGETYYACVAPASNVSFTARIDGYLSKKSSKTPTFAANKIFELGALPAPQKGSWNIRGSFAESNWEDVSMYKDINDSQVLKNVDFGDSGKFKFYNTTNGWSGYTSNNYFDKTNNWIYISGSGGVDIPASGTVDIYVHSNGWAFKIVTAGTNPF